MSTTTGALQTTYPCMTYKKPTNGLLTDRLNNTDLKTRSTNFTNNRRIETHQGLRTNFTRVSQPIPPWLKRPITFNRPTLWHHRLTKTIIHLTLKMTSAQVVKTSVTNNSSFQDYPHQDNHTIRTIAVKEKGPYSNMCNTTN